MFGESKRPFCFFGSGFDKRLSHLFYCSRTQALLNMSKSFFKDNLVSHPLTIQAVSYVLCQ